MIDLNTFSFFDMQQPIWFFVKLLVTIGFLLYLVFAFVVIKQVNKMTDTLSVGFEHEIRTIAVVHFLLALGTFLVSLIIL